ncbi:MAG: phosphonate ABC transporter, permease protein PhnE [Lachnospiraceae bacterium]
MNDYVLSGKANTGRQTLHESVLSTADHEPKAEAKIRISSTPKTKIITGSVAIITLFIIGLLYLNVSLLEIVVGFPAFLTFFFTRFFPPNFEHFNECIPLMLETINYAIVATVFSSVLALLISLTMSYRTNHITVIRSSTRFLITLLRNIPVIILASILVYIFGIGALSGIIALVFATLAFLSRAFAESLDDIPEEKLEALYSAGASRTQVFFEGILPNFTPRFLDWTLYIFQINILASVLLGLVGAGGIGMMVQNSIRLFQFHSAMAVIIIIVVMVVSTELITNKIRKLIR